MDYKFAYLVGALLVGVPWVVYYLIRKDLRKEMIFLSLFVSVLAVTEIWFYGKYWEPIHLYKIFGLNLGIEDVIICFFYGGFAAVTFQFFFGKYSRNGNKRGLHIRKYQIAIALLVGLVVLLMLELFTRINLTITSSIAQISVGIMLTIFRKDLFIINIINSLIFVVMVAVIQYIMTLIYSGVIDQFWQNDYLYFKETIFGIPLDEYIWHFSLAMAIGPAYEVFRGAVYKNKS